MNVCRKCSCDAGELQQRRDAGVFSKASDLPVLSMTFLDSGRVNASGSITLGKLYCSRVEFGKHIQVWMLYDGKVQTTKIRIVII